MKKIPGLRRAIASKKGSALLITLAFVILLTVLIVGFLSRSLLEERISSNSANQVKSDLFAEGVEANLIGDLEQEIINGSTSTTTGSSTLYVPKAAANMVPTYDYPSCPSGSTGPAATLANLLKVSNSSPVAASTFPTATGALTTTASLNGRSVSLARWGESQLVDPSAITNATFPTPNWIMVTRGGGTPPTSWNTNLTYNSSNKSSSTTVIGRYAYAVYDEGGLLDMNVAGYPTTSSTVPASILTQASYRSGEATADLTQLTSSGAQLLSNKQIDTIIGWRNNASVSPPAPTGTISAPANLALSNANNYFTFIQNVANGWLGASNSSVYANGTTYNTDQAFASRYELIQFMQALYGGTSPTTATNTSANTALQYMTHFSRSLSQPSVIPNPNRPMTPSSTGNDPTWFAAETNSAAGTDATINPSFLTVRVATAFTRNDGSAANVGDPLVKKRFNLNRLAWLTYEGPISDGSNYGTATTAAQVNASNADIQQLATYLNTYYGMSYAFLSQGTAGNIYNYFGLSWVKDDSSIRTKPLGDNQMKWYYNHSLANVASTATVSPYPTLPSSFSGSTPFSGCAPIANLSTIAALASARDPDFVELLKAGIAAGSKAKAATIPFGGSPANNTPAAGGTTTSITIRQAMPNNVANQVDTSLNFHLIQIFANIIDQYHLEGYPARIVYCDGQIVPKEFCGVENLPYFYRVRCCTLENLPPLGVGGSTTTGAMSVTSSSTHNSNPSITQAGAYTVLLVPELWNPHDQNSPRCGTFPSGSSVGNYFVDSHNKPLYPTSFRIAADSIDPDDVQVNAGTITSSQLATITTTYSLVGASVVTQGSTKASAIDPSYNYQGQLPWPAGATGVTQMQQAATKPFPMFADNSSLTFSIPSATSPSTDSAKGFYREPTLLLTASMPANSQLAAAGIYNFLYHPGASDNYTSSIPGGLNSTYPSIYNTASGGYPTGGYQSYISANGVEGSDKNYYLGLYFGTSTGAWISSGAPDMVNIGGIMDSRDYTPGLIDPTYLTYRVQYNNTYDAVTPGWTSYDTKYTLSGTRNATDPVGPPATTLLNAEEYSVAYDPRTYHFSLPHCCSLYAPGYTSIAATVYGWLDTTGRVLVSARPDYSNGYWTSAKEGPLNDPPNSEPDAYGWSTSGDGLTSWVSPLGLAAQNDPDYNPNGKVTTTTSPAVKYFNTPSATPNGGTLPQYYADPDGVVRRGTAAFASSVISPSVVTGLPTATANSAASAVETATSQVQSRPIILHRPFKSVGELGYVFSGTPWKNLDFNTPESGDAALLDLFTINDTTDPNGLIAGKVNLNTQQVPVLQALLAGAYKDEQAGYPAANAPNWGAATPSLSVTEATQIAKALAARTLSTNTAVSQGPLQNVSELVGKYVLSSPLSINNPNPNIGGLEPLIDGSKSYAGFTSDQIAASNTNDLTSAFTAASTTATTTAIQRMRESAIRALSASGQTRVWNVMIDVVAQTGEYPSNASTFDQFSVQGEQRYWIHLAIDRLTGQIIDKQVEVVKE
jgi:Tfp pilus assembly protein PilX